MTSETHHSGAAAEESQAQFGERIGDDTLCFRRHFTAPVERVWKALATPEGVGAWLGRGAKLEPRVGGHYEVWLTDDVRLDGRIRVFDPNRRLELAWREIESGEPTQHMTPGHDESIATFELSSAADGGTDFVFTHRYIRAGEDMLGFGAGWHAFFGALGATVQGGSRPDVGAEYARLRPLYERRFAGTP